MDCHKPMELGVKIKTQRLKMKLSLRKVCESVLNEDNKPISISYLNDIEQGYRKSPSGKIVVQIADVLKMNRQELLKLADRICPEVEAAIKGLNELQRRKLIEIIRNV